MLDEYLNTLGYSKEQIKTIHNIFPSSRYSESTLLYNIKNLYNYLQNNDVTKKEFIYITMTTPNIISESIENIKLRIEDLKSLGFNKINSFKIFKNYPYILEISNDKMQRRINKFKDLGFTKDSIIYFISEKAFLFRGDFSYYKKLLDYFIDYGYSKKTTINIFSNIPDLFDFTIEDIKEKQQDLNNMGFSNTDVIRITSLMPNLFLSTSDIINDNFNYLTSFGYTNRDIIETIKKIPIVLKDEYQLEIINKLDSLLKLGFDNKSIILMTCNNPYIFLYSEENLIEKYNSLLTYSFEKDEINKLLTNLPIIFGYDINYIDKLIKLYKKLKLDKYIIDNSKVLLFDIDLIKARYSYLSKKINIDNNINDLFLLDYIFNKKYKINNDKLLKGDF